MAAVKKSYKAPCLISGEKKQLNRILEEQDFKQTKKSGDNIASFLRRGAVLASCDLKNSKCQTALKRTKSVTTCPSENTNINLKAQPKLIQQQKQNAPLRARSVQNISRLPSANQGTTTIKGVSRTKVTGDKIKRAFSAHNVTMGNMALKSSKQNLSSKAISYNAELLMKFDEEKKVMEAKISELTELAETRKVNAENLKKDLEKEKKKYEMGSQSDGDIKSELELLRAENRSLKNQLEENGISVEHFTDSEKLFLINNITSNFSTASIFDSSDKLRMSSDDLSDIARRYMSAANIDYSNEMPSSFNNSNLDRHNSMSMDRGLNAVSVADLKDRFLQMQEAQHSVNEELQATLQELTDLQENVTQLNEANESLQGDNDILLESLCATTQKLDNTRMQVENLKSLLIRDIERNGNNGAGRERHLAELLQFAQQEKEELLLKQTECLKVISSVEADNRELRESLNLYKDSMHLEQEKNKALNDANLSLERQLEIIKRSSMSSDLVFCGKNASDTMMSTASIMELDKLLRQKEQELEEVKQESQEAVRDMKQQIDFLKEKILLQSQHSRELEKDLKNYLTSTRQLRAELNGCKKNLSDERAEWAQFQSDLLTAVVVANNLNMEKDNELKRITSELDDMKKRYHSIVEHISSKEFIANNNGLTELSDCSGEPSGHREEGEGEEGVSKADTDVLKFLSQAPDLDGNLVNGNGDRHQLSMSKESNNLLQSSSYSMKKHKSDDAGMLSPGRSSKSSSATFPSSEMTSPKLPGILVKPSSSDKRDERLSHATSPQSFDKIPSTSYFANALRSDPLAGLVKQFGGSKRNALLTWCQNKLTDYTGIEVTNFSSSWNDGLALCALMHTYLPHLIPYEDLKNQNVKQNFQCAFKAAKEAGLELGSEDDLTDLVATDRPAWQMVYNLVTNIYKHFEVENSKTSAAAAVVVDQHKRSSLSQR